LKRKLLVSSIYIWIGGCSVLIAFLLFFFAPIVSFKLFETTKYAELIRLASIQLPLSNLSMLGLVLLRFEKENLKFLKVIVINVFSSLVLIFLFVIYWRLGLAGVFYAQLGGILLSASLATYYVRHLFIFG